MTYSQFHDATGLVATHIATGYQWVVGVWECPYGHEDGWEVPAAEVDDAVAAMFERYDVWRMYADPPYWQSYVAQWQGRYGDERVIAWYTNRRRAMAYSLELYQSAIAERSLTHDGHAVLLRHIGNTQRHDLLQRDETGKPLWLIQKERPDSPQKIDLAMAAVLSWQARTDAVAMGVSDDEAPALLVFDLSAADD